MLGAVCLVYATPIENLRAAQAAADELDNLEGDEKRCMTEHLHRLLDAAATQQEAGCRALEPACKMRTVTLAESMVRPLGPRQSALMAEGTRIRLPAAVGAR
ncbi:hypothetical protein VPH35_052604 [Triticum aestivum]